MLFLKLDRYYITALKNLFLLLVILFLLFSTACSKGGGNEKEIENIYLDYHKALQAGDVKALENFLAADKKKELLGEDAALKIEMIKGFLPNGIKVTKITITGDKAVLEAEGTMPEQDPPQKMKGEVQFVKEGGKWKVVKEDWAVTIGMEGDQDASSSNFMPGPASFLKEGKIPGVFQVLKGHQGDISALAFTPDNRYLISAGYGDFSLRVWDITSGEEISKVRTENRVRGLAISPDNKTVLTADAYQYVIAWNLKEGILSNPQTLASKAGDKVAISPDGKTFVTSEFRTPLQLWNMRTGTLIKKLSDEENCRTVVFSPSGKYMAHGSPGNTFTLWKTKDWDDETYTISKVSATSDVFSIDISRDDKYLATGHMDSSIVIFDIEKEEELHNFYVPDASTMDVKFSPDGKLLATAQYNKTIYLWDVETAKGIGQLKRHSEAVVRLAFSPDGTTLASAGDDRQIIIWRCSDAKPFTHIPQPAKQEQEDTASGTETTPTGEPEMMEVDGINNLLKNPYANQGLQYWKWKGDVSVKADSDANSFFSVRYSGNIWQDVELQETDAGRWVLLLTLTSSERINPDGDQTGLPYLYGYMLNRQDPKRIDMYLQSDSLKHNVEVAGKWGVVYGIFKIPSTSGGIRLFLKQADGRYAQNGSAANFDEAGIYLFDIKENAEAFAEAYY